MEKKILVKNGIRREFSERAAKIAIEHLGWAEVTIFGRPAEIGTKTRPPVINKPIKLKEPSYPEPELKNSADIIVPKIEVTKSAFKPLPKADNTEKVSESIKKTRKMPVRSKSVKK